MFDNAAQRERLEAIAARLQGADLSPLSPNIVREVLEAAYKVDRGMNHCFYYLASPYTRFSGGHREAYRHACREASRLMAYGLHIFSPIVHSHSIAYAYPPEEHNPIPVADAAFWRRMNAPFVADAHGLIVLMLEGWDISAGVAYEIGEFVHSGRPVVYMYEGQRPEYVASLLGEKP